MFYSVHMPIEYRGVYEDRTRVACLELVERYIATSVFRRKEEAEFFARTGRCPRDTTLDRFFDRKEKVTKQT